MPALRDALPIGDASLIQRHLEEANAAASDAEAFGRRAGDWLGLGLSGSSPSG